ncbi:DUF4181 domain-containing protein [Alteribacter natronophilus]|uniref:DUF4181 domain-containing protein n=1 Tax=Alteribacter natronophilus TaxID=2583810 RepID=UPI0014867282|nr:DUF4181 domain-containing protein [Alteribacter natronophilus]
MSPMYTYGLPEYFWLILFGSIAGIFAIGYLSYEGMRMMLKLEKKPYFSYNHMNNLHKRIDWSLRGVFVAAVFGYWLLFLGLRVMDQPTINLHHLFFGYAIAVTALQTVMEWKYAEEKKAWILTASQLSMLLIIVSVLFATDFFGMLPPLRD